MIDENDDNSIIAPGQTKFDSGFALNFLAAGDFFFTVATFDNWTLTDNIYDGFDFDGEMPIPLSQWDQPGNDINVGIYWKVKLTYNDNINFNPVPELAAVWLFDSGLLGLLGFNRKRAQPLAA